MILDSILDSPVAGEPSGTADEKADEPTSRPDDVAAAPSLQALPQRIPVRAPMLRVLPGTPDSAKAARVLTRELLGGDHPATETAMLLVSELVTNSITHSYSGRPGGTVTVALCTGPAGVLIQVRDDGGPAEPRLPPADGLCLDGAEHGYGLVLVAALADTWGTLATAEGRVTWCRVSSHSERHETKV